jgi:hypothetical protein
MLGEVAVPRHSLLSLAARMVLRAEVDAFGSSPPMGILDVSAAFGRQIADSRRKREGKPWISPQLARRLEQVD